MGIRLLIVVICQYICCDLLIYLIIGISHFRFSNHFTFSSPLSYIFMCFWIPVICNAFNKCLTPSPSSAWLYLYFVFCGSACVSCICAFVIPLLWCLFLFVFVCLVFVIPFLCCEYPHPPACPRWLCLCFCIFVVVFVYFAFVCFWDTFYDVVWVPPSPPACPRWLALSLE